MRINPSQLTGMQTYKNQSKQIKQEEVRTSKGDKLEISSTTRELHSKYEAERQERIQEIKRQIDNGEFKVDPQKVAESIVAFWNL